MATKSRSEFEDGWYAYYGDEKPIGPFKTEYEAARAGLKEWGSNRD